MHSMLYRDLMAPEAILYSLISNFNATLVGWDSFFFYGEYLNCSKKCFESPVWQEMSENYCEMC